jgi:hypothetical protein
MIQKYVVISERKYVWGQLAGLPALQICDCTGHGTINLPKVGLVCDPCITLHQAKGNSDPRTFVNGWVDKFDKIFTRQTRSELTKSDISEAYKIVKTRNDFLLTKVKY